MSKKKHTSKVIPIDRVDDIERWILVPGTIKERICRRVKEIPFVRNNCFFAAGVPKSIFDFIYRTVKMLKLGERTLIFTRGTVRTRSKLHKYAVSVRELDWGVGTLITIPRILKYRENITLQIEGSEYTLRQMELLVLHGLLQIAYKNRNSEFYSTMAALVLSRGWKQLDLEELPTVLRKM